MFISRFRARRAARPRPSGRGHKARLVTAPRPAGRGILLQAAAGDVPVWRKPPQAATDSPSAFGTRMPCCRVFTAALMSRQCSRPQVGHGLRRTGSGSSRTLVPRCEQVLLEANHLPGACQIAVSAHHQVRRRSPSFRAGRVAWHGLNLEFANIACTQEREDEVERVGRTLPQPDRRCRDSIPSSAIFRTTSSASPGGSGKIATSLRSAGTARTTCSCVCPAASAAAMPVPRQGCSRRWSNTPIVKSLRRT